MRPKKGGGGGSTFMREVYVEEGDGVKKRESPF